MPPSPAPPTKSNNPPLTLPNRAPDSHKGTFGRVLLIGGSRGMAGSIALSSIAALHTGSGLVVAAVPNAVLESVAAFHPAIMTMPLADEGGLFATAAWSELRSRLIGYSAIGCGPGMTTHRGSVTIVDGLLASRPAPMVVDADALNVIAHQGWIEQGRLEDRGPACPAMVWTPHPGEFERLSGVSAKDRVAQCEAAEHLAARTGATIVLKGGPTRVTGQQGNMTVHYVNETGNPGMATAGCGDVLTGIITSLLGQGLSGWDAARLGVWLHGRAGDAAAAQTSRLGMTAADVLVGLARVADEMTDHQ